MVSQSILHSILVNYCFLSIDVVPASPPQTVTATTLSSIEIQVSWTEVSEIHQNGIINFFEVMYEPLMTFDVLTALTVNTTNLSITLMNLEEYVEYNISVRAYTSVGSGPYSVGIVWRTFEAGVHIIC